MIKIKREEINPIIIYTYNFTQISMMLYIFLIVKFQLPSKVADVWIIPIKFDIRSTITFIFGQISVGFSRFIQDVSRL